MNISLILSDESDYLVRSERVTLRRLHSLTVAVDVTQTTCMHDDSLSRLLGLPTYIGI